MTDVTIPAFAKGVPIAGAGSTIGLKVQRASDSSGAYVPVVALDNEEISIGAVSQEGTWTVGVASLPSLSAGTNEIGFVGPSGSNGVDYSANAPSLSGLSLLATIPANTARLGYFIQAQGTAALTIAMDDQAGSLTPTIIVLAGAASNGGQGGSLAMDGMAHSGRIRIYSTSSGVQMAARAW